MRLTKFISVLTILIILSSCKEKEEAKPIKFSYTLNESNTIVYSNKKTSGNKLYYKISNPDNHSYRFKMIGQIRTPSSGLSSYNYNDKYEDVELAITKTTNSYLEYESPLIDSKQELTNVYLTLIVNTYPAYNNKIETVRK